MGSFIGHVAPGFGFFIIGLWHLINHSYLHALNPKSYKSSSIWFPIPKIKYMELYLIMAGCSTSIAMELFVGPRRHQPLDLDGTIPSNHLHNFEHSTISLTIFVYALFSIIIDKFGPPAAKYELTHLFCVLAFGQELFLFHLHSTDHSGVEGQYHFLLQIIVFISLVTTLLGINCKKSFLNSFVRSISILFQGIWLNVIGFMLWTPSFVPKGCFLKWEEGHQVMHCHGEEALKRAKSLANIQFSWYIVGVTILAVTIYLAMVKTYSQKVEFYQLMLSKSDQLHNIIHVESELGDVDDHVEVHNYKVGKPNI